MVHAKFVEKANILPRFFLKETIEEYRKLLKIGGEKYEELRNNSSLIKELKERLNDLSVQIKIFLGKKNPDDLDKELNRRNIIREERCKKNIKKEKEKILLDNFLGFIPAWAEKNARRWEWRKIYSEGSKMLESRIESSSDKERVLVLYAKNFFLVKVKTVRIYSVVVLSEIEFVTNSLSQMNTNELVFISLYRKGK